MFRHGSVSPKALLLALALTSQPAPAGGGILTSEELQQIESELGATLSDDDQLALGSIVKPATSPPWRTAAEARIEQHRKADLQIEVVDALGLPVPGAAVEITLRRKHFRFGGIMDLKKFAGVTPTGIGTTGYQELFLKLYDHAGLNNGLKPKLRAGNEPLLPGFFSWAEARDLGVRGHLLIWPGGTHMSAGITALVEQIEQSTDPAEIETLKPLLRQAVHDEISEWAGRWAVGEWDVMNEVLGNRRIQDILGDQEMIAWCDIAQANAVDPGCRFLINEFQIISARSTGTTYASRSAGYKRHIEYLLDGGAPLTSIGFQSRFKFEHPDPALLYQRIEEFAAYGLPMVGTEFEIKELDPFLPSEPDRGRMTEEIMTTYFSHPLMDGLYAWTYLDDAGTTAMVADDGTVKLNGLVWYYLNRIRYHTSESLVTDAGGRAGLRGFKGDYDVTVTVGGQAYPATLSLAADGLQQVAIPHSAPADSDGDGLHDTWELTHAPDLGTMDDTTDTDGDGLIDLGEFRAGTDPNNPREFFEITGIGPGAGAGIRLEWNSRTGTLYRVWKSPDLAPGGWQVEVPSIEATGPATAVPINESASAMFYQVEILVP